MRRTFSVRGERGRERGRERDREEGRERGRGREDREKSQKIHPFSVS